MKRAALLVVLFLVCPGTWAEDASPEDVLRRRLDETKINVEIDGTSLAKVLLNVARLSRVSVVLDPQATSDARPAGQVPVKVQALDLPMREFLDRILVPLRLRFVIADAVVLVTDAREVTTTVMDPDVKAEDRRKLSASRVSFEVEGRPLREVIESVGRVAGFTVEFRVTAQAPRTDAPVTCVLYEVSALDWLNWAARFENLRWTLDDGRIVLGDRMAMTDIRVRRLLREKTVTLEFNRQPIQAALDLLMTLTNTNIILDRPKIEDQEVTLRVTDAPVQQTMDELTKQLGLVWTVHGGVIHISDAEGLKRLTAAPEPAAVVQDPGPADRKVLEGLQETIVGFTFNEQPVGEALDFFRTLGNVNIVCDRRVMNDEKRTVTLGLRNVPLETALRLTTEKVGRRFIIREGVVFVATEAGLKRRAEGAQRSLLPPEPTEADRKVLERLQKTIVSFTFNEQPVFEAFDFLQTIGNVNIVCDRRVMNDEKRTVTLGLWNVPLETAVKLLTEQLALGCIVQDGVVFVSDEKTLTWRRANPERLIMPEKPTEMDLNELQRITETRVSLNFHRQPVVGALDFLQTLGQRSIRPDKATFIDADMTLTLKLVNVPLKTALLLVSEQLGLRCGIKDGVVVIGDEQTLRPPQ